MFSSLKVCLILSISPLFPEKEKMHWSHIVENPQITRNKWKYNSHPILIYNTIILDLCGGNANTFRKETK